MMIEIIFIIGIFFWAIGRLIVWIFDSLLGILPIQTAENIRRWTRFGIAVIVVLMILSAAAGTWQSKSRKPKGFLLFSYLCRWYIHQPLLWSFNFLVNYRKFTPVSLERYPVHACIAEFFLEFLNRRCEQQTLARSHAIFHFLKFIEKFSCIFHTPFVDILMLLAIWHRLRYCQLFLKHFFRLEIRSLIEYRFLIILVVPPF